MATALDNALVSNVTYGDDAEIHRLLTDLRKNDPVHWTEPDGFRPFWSITKYADILEIEKLNDQFLNEPRSVLMNIEADQATLTELEHAFKFNDAVLRHLIMKTDKAVTAPSPMMKDEKSRSLTQQSEAAPQVEVRTGAPAA